MNRRSLLIAAYVAWCVVALAAFTIATQEGYAAFAASSRPTPLRPAAGQNHK